LPAKLSSGEQEPGKIDWKMEGKQEEDEGRTEEGDLHNYRLSRRSINRNIRLKGKPTSQRSATFNYHEFFNKDAFYLCSFNNRSRMLSRTLCVRHSFVITKMKEFKIKNFMRNNFSN